jgi:hypothetical protein
MTDQSPTFQVVAERTTVTPGQQVDVPVHLSNLGTRPLSFVLRLIGIDDSWTAGPRSSGVVAPGATVTGSLPVTFPLGFPPCEHLAGVQVQPLDPDNRPVGAPQVADVELVVGDGSMIDAALEPGNVESRGRFVVRLHNRGLEPTTVALDPAVSEDGMRLALNPGQVALAPGGRAEAVGKVSHSRPLFGTTRRMPFSVTVRSRATPVHLSGTLTQPPIFSGGMMKVVAAIGIVCMWVTLLVFGLNQIGNKVHPKSNQPSTAQAAGATANGGANGNQNGGGAGGAGGASGSGGSGGSGAAGAGPVANGGNVNGQVTAEQPGGISVTLAPTSLVDEKSLDATFHGVSQPAAGKSFGADLLDAPRTVSLTRTTLTDDGGNFAFAGVPAPGYYLVTFTKAGYETSKHVISLDDASKPVKVDVSLVAGQGQISGITTAPGGGGLGAVDITVSGGGTTLTTKTPTTGQVGRWSIDGLSTPGTYLVTASRSGYGTQTTLVTLGPGASMQGANLPLTPGVGSITGMVTSTTGPVGGVSVSVTDGDTTRTVTTLTVDPIGTFTLPTLAIPGSYTLTISGDGWSTQTQHVDLKGNLQLPPISLTSTTASVVGTLINSADQQGIEAAGVVLTSAQQQPAGTVTQVSDSATVYKTTSTGNPPGAFQFTGIAPGTYTLTASKFGHQTFTTSVTVGPGGFKDLGNLVLQTQTATTVADQGSLTITATDQLTTKPIDDTKNAWVTLYKVAADGSLSPITYAAGQCSGTATGSRCALTDGAVSINGLAPGLLQVQVGANGYQPSQQGTRISNTSTASLSFTLIPLANVTGTLRSNAPGNPPAAFVTVSLKPLKPLPAGLDVPPSCRLPNTPSDGDNVNLYETLTDASGNFSFQPITSPPISSECPGVYSNDYSVSVVSSRCITPYPTDGFVHSLDCADPTAKQGAIYLPPGAKTITATAGNTTTTNFNLDQFGSLQVNVVESENGGPPSAPKDPVTVNLFQATIFDVIFGGGCPTGGTPAQTGTTDPTGQITFTGLEPPSTNLAWCAEATNGTSTANSLPQFVYTNSTATAAIALIAPADATTGTVQWNRDGTNVGIQGIQVTSTGSNLVNNQPDPNHAYNTTTGTAGAFTFAPTNQPQLNPVTITAATGTSAIDNDFNTGQAANVTLGSHVSPIVLTPKPGPLTGTITLQPSVAPPAISVTATQTPPGFNPSLIHFAVQGTSLVALDANNNVASVPPGTYSFNFTATGWDPASATVFIAPNGDYTSPGLLPTNPPGHTADATMYQHGSISVSTDSVSDDPLAGPVVGGSLNGVTYTAQRLNGAGNPLGPPVVVTEPNAGSHTFTDLTQGTYQVTVALAGYGAYEDAAGNPNASFLATTTLSLSPGGTPGATLYLQKLASINGVISYTNGTASGFLSNASVTVQQLVGGTLTGPVFGPATTAASNAPSPGSYSVTGSIAQPGLRNGTYRVTATATGYGTKTLDVTVSSGQDYTGADLTLGVLPASFAVKVIDSSGAALSGALVTVSGGSTATGGAIAPVTTIGDGLATFTGLAPGQFSVTASKQDFKQLGITITLSAGQDATNPPTPITLPTNLNTIKGSTSSQVGNKTPSPVGGVAVKVTSNSDSTKTYSTTSSCTGSGQSMVCSYSIANLPADTYTVTYDLAGYSTVTLTNFNMSDGTVYLENETMSAKARTVNVSVVSAVGNAAVQGVKVQLQDPLSGTSVAGTVTTDGSGDASFQNVLPGSYTVSADGTSVGHQTGTLGITINPANGPYTAPSAVKLVEGLLRLNVTVNHGTGAAPTVTVTATPTTGTAVQLTQVSGSGPYQAFVAPTSYTVTASVDGATDYTTYTSAATAVTSGSTETLSATLTEYGVITVSPDPGLPAGSKTVITVTNNADQSHPPHSYPADTGTTTYSNLPPGTYTVTATAEDASGTTLTYTANPNKGDDVTFTDNSVTVTSGATATVTLNFNYH